MRTRLALSKIEPLLKLASFTSQQARARGVSSEALAHYVKIGELVRIGHGVYRKTDHPAMEDFRWEDLIEAVQKTKDGAICLISALALYEITEETPRQHWIAVKHSTRHRSDTSTKIVRMRNVELGRTSINISGVVVPIFDQERTVLDAFKYLGRETAIKALRMGLKKKSPNKIDPRKLQEYAKKLRINIAPYLLAETTL
jgi:predicted transcriptional regulator of viral defense system